MSKVDIVEKKALEGKEYPEFKVGDTVKVSLRVKEGNKSRTQVFEGTCISRRGGKGMSATFSVIKETHGNKVEKTFPLYTPSIEKIEVTRQGSVRRAKLYNLREVKG